MSTLRKISTLVVTALGLTAGIPKLARVPNEVDFFAEVGIGTPALMLFGALQLAGGLLMVLPRSRRVGAVLVATMFLASGLMLLSTGQVAFGLVSLLPVAMAGLAAGDDGWREH